MNTSNDGTSQTQLGINNKVKAPCLKVSLIIPCVMIVLLLLAWAYRWDYGASKSISQNAFQCVIKWKTDRWAGQGWMEVYSTQRSGEIAQLPGTKDTNNAWATRRKLTNYWIVAFSFSILLAIWLMWGGKVLQNWLDTRKQKQSIALESIPVPQVRPWVRYWAKMLDVMLVGVLGGILFYTSDPAFYDQPMFYVTALVSLVPIESILLSTWGTTPGKWLLRIDITDEKGQKLSFVTALKRNSIALLVGLGVGLPLLSLITLIYSYYYLNNSGKTYWDKQVGSIVYHKHIGFLRGLTAAIFIIFIIGLSSIPVE